MFSFNYVRSAFRASKYGKVALIVLFAGLIVASATLGTKPANWVDAAGALACAGPSTLAIGQEGTWTASGGNGNTYEWSSAQKNATGQTYKVSFPNGGKKEIVLTAGMETATCTVQISNTLPAAEGPLSCAGPATLEIGQSGTFTGQGSSSGNYHWVSAQKVDDGATYTVSFPNSGPKTINITSGSQSGTCSVQVKDASTDSGGGAGGNTGGNGGGTPITQQPLKVSCSGRNSNSADLEINPGDTVRWTADVSGGTGTGYVYTWTGNGSFPSGVTGNPVSHTYLGGEGQRNANVTVQDSAGNTGTASCNVQVVEAATVANPASPAGCAPLQHGQITESGSVARVRVTNPNPVGSDCAQKVGLASYKIFVAWNGSNNNEYLNGQQLFANRSWTIMPGERDVLLEVSIPTCQFQVDLFEGSQPKVPPFYGSELLAWLQNHNLPLCQTTRIPPPPRQQTPDIFCSPIDHPAVNVNQAVVFNASGGDGAFHWTASGGSPSTGNTSRLETSWSTDGKKLVLVSDNSGHSAQCNVQINRIVIPGVPSCSPHSRNANLNQNLVFNATGGNGSFSWSVSGSGASRTSGTGTNIDVSFSNTGTKTVTVTSNGLTDSCLVFINEDEKNDDLSCSPSNQDADVDDFVTFRASGGTGTYRWTADEGDADPDSDTGRTFTTQFGDEGRHTVRVRDSAGRTATCRVNIEEDFTPRRLSCSPSSQTANVNERIEFFANGGTGNFEWDADDGSPRSGFNRRFTTSFDEPGRYEVEVESNGRRDTCEVQIVDNDRNAPFCTPSAQNANVNDFVTFSASGGNGSFFWNTVDGSPVSGSGSAFGTRFLTPGTKFVTVSSNGRTSQCIVTIGSVLGASTVVTGPAETAAAAAGLGFLGALGAYGAVYRERSKKLLAKITRIGRR